MRNTIYGSMGAQSPWMDAMNRQANPSATAGFGPGAWNWHDAGGRPVGQGDMPVQYAALNKMIDQVGNWFGGRAGGAAGGVGAAGGGLGPMNIQTPYNPAPVYDPTSLQIARNQMRAQVPTALASGVRNTPAGVSQTMGGLSDIASQRQALNVAGEEGVQMADLQARLANAQNMLAGQTGVMQTGLGLAGGLMDRSGTNQRLRYGLAGQGIDRASLGLDRGNMGLGLLLSILGQS